MYLIRDGLLVKPPEGAGILILGVPQGPRRYILTDTGAQFVARMRAGAAVEDIGPPV